MSQPRQLWAPNAAQIEAARMTAFLRDVQNRFDRNIENYNQLYRWSIDEKEAFWSLLWDFCGVIGTRGERILVDGDDIERARWFPDARLNFAENLLRRRDDTVAIHFRAEDRVEYRLTWAELHDQVASLAGWMREQGLEPGDRVAGYLPNMPETVIAMLASASLGAVWTSTSPDFGEDSVVDRFGQTEPRILFVVDGYYYAGKRIDLAARVDAVVARLPSVEQVVQVELIGAPRRAVDRRRVEHPPAAEELLVRQVEPLPE